MGYNGPPPKGMDMRKIPTPPAPPPYKGPRPVVVEVKSPQREDSPRGILSILWPLWFLG